MLPSSNLPAACPHGMVLSSSYRPGKKVRELRPLNQGHAAQKTVLSISDTSLTPILLSDSDHAETREVPSPQPSQTLHTFLSSQPPFPAYRKHAVLWALTQEPGDSAAIKLQLQEATEQTELHDIPKCPQLLPLLEDSLTGSQPPVLHTLYSRIFRPIPGER